MVRATWSGAAAGEKPPPSLAPDPADRVRPPWRRDLVLGGRVGDGRWLPR
jgi:hypothetical protein